MARSAPQKDLLSRLADAGEAAIQRLGEVPGADQLMGAANALRDRMDELQRRVRGLEALEQRLAELERKVDRLAKAQGRGASRATTRKTSAARKTASTEPSEGSTEASRSRAGRTRG